MHPVSAAERHLSTEHLGSDLKGRSVRGGAVTLFGQGCRSGLYLIATVVLARMLDPRDFGLIAMVSAVTGFLAQFRDLGLSMSTIQKADITARQISALFWLNAGFGACLALLAVGTAPVLAWFYGEPRLAAVTAASSVGFLVGGLAVQHQALMRRQMRFAAITALDVISMGIGVSAAVTTAYFGAGYWALVIMELSIGLSTLAGVWLLCDWRPGPPERGVEVRSLLTFGGQLTGFNLVNYLVRNLDKLLIGRRWGPLALGFYTKAYDLLMLPLALINTPFSTVAIPGLSRLQYDLPRFRAYYLRALALTMVLSMPVATFLIVMADEVVALLLGPQWSEAAVILRLLAISAALQPVVNTAGWLYVAAGRTARMLRWGLIAAGVTITALVVGLPYGPRGVALGYALAMLLLVGPCMRFALADLPISLSDVMAAVWRPAAAAALSAAAAYAVKMVATPRLPDWGVAILGASAMLLAYSLVLFCATSTRGLCRDVLGDLVLVKRT